MVYVCRMQKFIYIFIGGGLGCVCRYIAVLAMNKFECENFPWGTAFVNISGSFLIGIILGFAITKPALSQGLMLFLITGFLGGFTTFSAFSWESFALLKNHGIFSMVQNISVN